MAWAVYARQSVEKKNSISIESQIEFCKKVAGQELSVYLDRGQEYPPSGFSETFNRCERWEDREALCLQAGPILPIRGGLWQAVGDPAGAQCGVCQHQ